MKARTRPLRSSTPRASTPTSSSGKSPANPTGNRSGAISSTSAASLDKGRVVRRASHAPARTATITTASPDQASNARIWLRIGRTTSCWLTSATSHPGVAAPSGCTGRR